MDRLWTDYHHNACDVLNRSVTKSNKGMTTPYEMRHGVKPSPTLIQWLQRCFYRVKRKHKTDAQAKPGLCVGPAWNHPRDSMRIYSQEKGEIVISRDVTWRHVPTPPLTSVPQSISAPSERGETESAADESMEGREGTSRQGGGGVEESDSDDDLEVTWESDTPDAAEGTDDAISDKPVASEGSSPSTVISRPGSFGGGESISPSNSSNSSSSSSNSIDSEMAGNSNVAQRPEKLPKGEKNRLESWPFRGQPLVSSRLRQRQVVGEPEEESEDSEHALLAELREAKKLEQEDESEEGLGGYDYNVLSDLLALRPLEFDVKESNNNVLSLMSSMDDEYDDIALVVEGTEGESEFEMPSGPISEAETPPVSVGGVLKSRYQGAWFWAMNGELKGLKDSGTFKVLDGLPEGEKVIGSRWVLSYKSNKDGNITKTKARLVAKGFMQREGVNLLQTSAPTPAGASVKTMLVVANEMGFKTYHLDLKQAFTKAKLDCKIIMKLPGGCGELSGKYVDLEKAMYGLKQNLLVDKLVSVHGMEQCMTDPCVFRLIREGKLVLILDVHVDDMAVAGTRVEVNKLLVTLNKDFETNDLGKLSFFTGCTITRDTEKGLTSISQKTFIETLARRFDVTTTSPYPASPCVNLGARVESESGGTWPYKEAVGGLLWLVVMSRPDITNAVRVLSRHSNSPAERHCKAVLQIIRYLLGTEDLSLTFEWGSGLEISVLADANYAKKADGRRSVSGVAVTVGKSSASWFNSTQKIVTLSTIEAEYVALGDGVKEALFVKGVLSFIIPSISENCIKVFVDNDGAISLANNP